MSKDQDRHPSDIENLLEDADSRKFGRGDFVKLGAAAGMSLLFPGSAKAAINAVGNVPPKPLYGPPGVKEISDFYSGASKIVEESGLAMEKVDGRWEGILYLHKGSTPNHVNLTSSPTAYYSRGLGNQAGDFTNRTNQDYLYLIKPYIISNFKGRTYAVVLNGTSVKGNWAFLDLAWAKINGTLSPLAIKGMAPRTKPFRFGQDLNDMPGFDFTSIDPSEGWVVDPQEANKQVFIALTKAWPKIRTKK